MRMNYQPQRRRTYKRYSVDHSNKRAIAKYQHANHEAKVKDDVVCSFKTARGATFIRL